MSKVDEKMKERILSIACGEGIKWGIGGFVIGGTGAYVASVRSVNFMKYMSVSAKTSIPIMTGVFLFGLQYELTMNHARRYPELYGLSEKNLIEGKVTTMPVHHRILNFLYDNPFTFILCTGVPFASAIFKQQMQYSHLKFSQRVMHTRVFAQGGIITIAMTTMAFREYMDRRGRFPEPST